MVASFIGGGQLNPFSADPMALLSTSAMQDQQTPPVQAPAFSAPQTPAVAGAGPNTGGTPTGGGTGGGGVDFGSIGSRIGDAFSGKGIFGGASDDAEIDPVTGAPKGLSRQANGRSMLQLGLTMLMAGQRMSNDQRAAILSKAPGLVGGSDDAVNSFAKSRLEMAKLRMEQQKMQQEQQSAQMLNKALGLDSGAAPAPSAGAQGVQAGQQALAQSAPAQTPGDANAAPGGGIPANAAADYQSPTPAPAAPASAAPASIASPGGVPRAAPQQQATGSGDDPRNWTHGEKLAVAVQPTTAGKAAMFGQIQAARAAGTRMGPVQYDRTTGEQYANTLDGRGNVTGRTSLGKPTITTRDTGDFREKGYTDPVTGQFVVTERSDIAEKPADAEDRRLQSGILRDNYKELNSAYQDTAQKTVQSYDKLSKIRNAVQDGSGIFGTGADLYANTVKTLASYGMINPKAVKDLITNDNFMRASKEGVANVIKDFNGSQGVSNADRDFAVSVMGASIGGTRDQVLNSISNGMIDAKNSIARYNENAKLHNENVQSLPEGTRKLLTARTVDRNFDDEEKDYNNREQVRISERQAKYDGTAPAVTAPAPAVAYLKSNPNMAAQFDAKYGKGAAARILGK